MEKRISELLAEMEPAGIELEGCDLVSPDRIKETTMNKIRANKKRNKTMVKLSRIAIIAACLCLVLAASVFAAGKLLGLKVKMLDESPVDGSSAVGFTAVVEYDGETIEEYPEDGKIISEGNTEENLVNEIYMPVRKLDAEVFSDELLAQAAEESGFNRMDFQSFSDFEEYIGIEIFNNHILDEARQGSTYRGDTSGEAERYNCVTEVLSEDGKLIGVNFDACYMANYTEMTDDEIREKMEEIREQLENDPNADPTFATKDFVQVYLTVKLYTANSPILASDMFGSHLFPEGTTFTSQSYTSPDGLEAAIISAYMPHGSVWHYAKLGINNAAVTLQVSNADPEYALETLKSIIDAFEY